MNALFPIAAPPFSSGSSDGALEIRCFFVLPDAFAGVESLSESCTGIFRLIRCGAEFSRTECCKVNNMKIPS